MNLLNKITGTFSIALLLVTLVSSCTRPLTVCECRNWVAPAQKNYNLGKKINMQDAQKKCDELRTSNKWETCIAKEIN